MRMPEIRSMVYRSLLGRCAPEYFGSPGVEVRVKVDHADGTVCSIYGAKEGERDGVVAAEGYEAGEGFFLEGGANFCCVGHGGAH